MVVASSGVDQVLERAVAQGVAAGVVALATDDQGVIYEGAFGKREIGRDADMTLDTVVWIASMSKAITSVAAMQLVEQGRIGLDEPLSDRLPELAGIQVLEGFDDAGAPRLRPPRRPITLRHLLTHTAGFTYDIWNQDMGRYQQYAAVPGIIECKNLTLQTPLVFDPGERWEYGVNLDWVGKTVEQLSGQSLEAYFKEHIFGPLGMDDTGFVIRTEVAPTGRSAGSLCWAGLGNTYFWIDPTRRVAGVILTQILPFADAAVLDMYDQFERAIYARVSS